MQKRHRFRKNKYKSIEKALNLRSTDAIIQTTEELGALVLAQRIPFQAMQAINGGISNILRIYCPSGGTTQTVQVNVDPEPIIGAFLNTLPPQLRNAIVAYGRTQAKLEQVATIP